MVLGRIIEGFERLDYRNKLLCSKLITRLDKSPTNLLRFLEGEDQARPRSNSERW